MIYSDDKLRLALAKMLPDKIEVHDYTSQISHPCFMWSQSTIESGQIKPTEWLHVCWLVEQTLFGIDALSSYRDTLVLICGFNPLYWTSGTPQIFPADYFLKCACASWQQRATALAKVKGVEIENTGPTTETRPA